MWMYTELNIDIRLKEKTPKNIIDVLEYMLDNERDKPETPKHRLFDTDRWSRMLKSNSYYFDGNVASSLKYDDIANEYFLNLQFNLKNYWSEIEKFVDWIKPHASRDGFWWYTRYEEEELPTLIINGEFKTISKLD